MDGEKPNGEKPNGENPNGENPNIMKMLICSNYRYSKYDFLNIYENETCLFNNLSDNTFRHSVDGKHDYGTN